MGDFTEEHSKALLGKEWTVKIDSQSSTPYLFKFHASTVDRTCCLLVTDTKTTWAEVLNSKQIARRWQSCNPNHAPLLNDPGEEEAWRMDILALLSTAHTLGGILDTAFEVVETNYSDFAFELQFDRFKWRWETIFVGNKTSAVILSMHLIMPLISVNHLAFTSPDPVGVLSAGDLEKTVDKVGRIARRTMDTHLKNALSKPRVATTLRRISATLNSLPDLPAVILEAEKPDLQIPKMQKRQASLSVVLSKLHSVSPDLVPENSDSRDTSLVEADPLPGEVPHQAMHTDSATESENEEVSPYILRSDSGKERASRSPPAALVTNNPEAHNVGPSEPAILSSRRSKGPPSDSDSSPLRPPAKKPKTGNSSDDDDSEEERKRHIAQLKSGAGGKRGIRQPLKRGGRRF